jgi:hypothetical protein
MASTNERVSVLETKVDDIKVDLSILRQENREDHGKVMAKLDNLRDLKNYIMGATAIAAALVGWIATQVDWHFLFNNAPK